MRVEEIGDSWRTAWLIFCRRPWLWLWMGFLASLGWIAMPAALVFMRWIGAGQDYLMDMTDPGFFAQSAFVMATQWASAAGIVRMAHRQLEQLQAPTSAYIEGFFGGFITFPPAALAALIYDQLHQPGWQLFIIPAILLLLPIHQFFLSAVAERGTLMAIHGRLMRSLRAAFSLTSFGLSASSLAIAIFAFGISYGMAKPLPEGNERQIAFFSIAFFLTIPCFALHYLAWARYWQKITAVPAPVSQNP